MEIATIESIFFAQAGMGFKVYKPCTRGSVHAVTTGFKGYPVVKQFVPRHFVRTRTIPRSSSEGVRVGGTHCGFGEQGMSRVGLRRLQSQVGSCALKAGNQRQVSRSAVVASSESKGSAMAEEASGVLARVAQLVQRERLVSDK